jgi:hypothetical protein
MQQRASGGKDRMSRRPEHIPKRKAFPKPVKAAVLQRSGGMCEAPGCDRVGRDFDHIRPVSIRAETTVWTTVSFYVGRAMPPRASQRRRTPLSLIGRVDAAGNTQGATAPRPTARTNAGQARNLRAALLRRRRRDEEENARLRAALQAIVDNAEIGEREADAAFARAALSKTGAA